MRGHSTTTLAVIAASGLASVAWAIQTGTDEAGQAYIPQLPTHMPEEARRSLRKVVVFPSEGPAGQAVTGDYRNQTLGFGGGAAKGAEAGKGIQTEVGGIPIGFPIRILTLPGAIIGGVSGFTERQIQEFRDGLTQDLVEATGQPLTNDAIASDVFWGIRKMPDLEPKILSATATVPEDTDAILYVSLSDITINVQGKEAIITASANATLQRASDNSYIFRAEVHYQDRDTLSNWNEDNHAIWHDYINFAKHYLGREISAEIFDRVELNHELKPTKTKSIKPVKKDEWRGVSKTQTPTLAWELDLLGGDSYGAWVNGIDPAQVLWDVEVYDRTRLVYVANNVPASSHTIEKPLERCKTYRWSVRPAYRADGTLRYGEWMRANGGQDTDHGGAGVAASVAPAYIYDYASLEIKCR